MPAQNEVDEQTIRQLLSAFEVAMANCNAADASVDAVNSSMQWHGEARTLYGQELSNWRGGLNQVRNGLEMLRTAMGQYLQATSNAELETSSHSRWYQGD
ncbi:MULTISPECIES: hypothetical protein [unclassified Micromonospora]|uniref:hypothetical protein n=1 Tax=unclassified Micromonospora TaxID=2617518 RepID=UPI00103310DB|nr:MULTISPECIES: hypothetical protein [unclassified Micromonospora]QKW13585.1 hypothetical protein HUT12_12860 [Verrucosispora sp. NA02020]TBL34423.1 hypothetical protein EYA84_15560 [Verrucosispora sp. SN26_14.1]